MPGSSETLERMEAIARKLTLRPRTTTELANELEVNSSTIYRNIQSMRDRGWPIECDRDLRKGRRYWIDKHRTLNSVHVTLHEATALYLAARLLSRTIDTSNPFVAQALHKLADPLEVTAPTIAQQIRHAAHAVRVQPNDETVVEVFGVLAQAWGESRKVRIHYRSRQSETAAERIISPYYLEAVDAEQAFYVLGYDSLSNAMRVFKLDRIEAIELLRERFRIPDGFEPLEQLQSAWGIMWADEGKASERVVLQFMPDITREIKERCWHPTQQLTDLADGGCRFEVTVGHASELRRWIRRWGLHQVEVLEPHWLRDEFISEARAVLERYGEQ
jgi:predicted DNA-binding transcriptional regulator YafY